MKDNLIRLSENIIFGLTILVAAGTPLFFLPFSSEFFEFSKFNLLLAAAILGAFFWALRMVLLKRFAFTSTPLDIPFIVFLLVTAIASFSSIDQYISFFGIMARPWPSFFSLSAILVFYFVTVSNLKSKKQVNIILWVLAGATTIASIIGIASYFGLFLPADFAKNRTFNPLGVINTLALVQALVIPLLVSWIVFSTNKTVRALSTAGAVVNLISFILISYLAAYFGLVIGLLLLGAVVLKLGRVTRPAQASIGIVTLIVIVTAAVRFIPQLSSATLGNLIQNKPANTPASQLVNIAVIPALSQRLSWDIATSTIGKRPIFGTGPGTYMFAYTQLKPRAVNSTTFWNIRFDKAASDFTEIIATAGIVGIAALIFVLVTVIRFIWTLVFKSNNTLSYIAPAASVVTYVVLSFFTTSTISTTITFFLALGALVALAKSHDEKHVHEMVIELATLRNSFNWLPTGSKLASLKASSSSKNSSRSQLLPYAFMAAVLVASYFAAARQVSALRAEYSYRQALTHSAKNDGANTIKYLQEAININPHVDVYHRDLSSVALSAAFTLSSNKDITDEQKNLINQLVQVAVDQGKVASGYQILPLRVPGISASNAANWETISAAYQALIGQLQGADVNALNTLSQASALDPENPILHDRIGGIYRRVKNLDSAQRKFEDAIITKNDYGPAHYNLALLLIEKKGDVTRIAQELTLAKRFLPANDPAMDDINKNLEVYNEKAEEAQKAANEALSASPIPGASPSPKPSGTPSPSSKASPASQAPTFKPSPTPGL